MNHKRLIFILVIISLLVFHGISFGLTIYTEVSGLGAYGYPADSISPRVPFTLEFYASFTSGDENELGWSTPFVLYGTSDVIALLDTGVVVTDPTFDNIWDAGAFANYRESWDGDLTNSGDLFNYSGLDSRSPHLPSSGTMHLFDVEIPGIAGFGGGQFCVDSGDAINSGYDWMFMSPSSSFEEICRAVVARPCGVAYFENCPSSVDTVIWNNTYTLDLTTAANNNLKTYFSYLDDPTGHASLVIIDSTNDPNGQAQFTFTPDIGDIGLQTFVIGVYNGCIPYPSGAECTFEVQVINLCGDVNLDGLVNIFDITYLIEYLYQEGPAPNPMESADVNNDSLINIFDITHLIGYLYLEGPPPTCP